VIAGVFAAGGAKAQYVGQPRKHDEKAAQPKCAPPTSEQQKASSGWLQDRLADLLKQTMEAEDAVTEFKAKNNIVGAGKETIGDQQIVELSTELTEARSQLSDARPSGKQILETRIQNLEAELKTAVSKLRASEKALTKLRELESIAQSYRALYDGLLTRHSQAILRQQPASKDSCAL
jgi:uncharacterized protein involved in exopolysaccharide biosynthesis